jgi:hypothetical protein
MARGLIESFDRLGVVEGNGDDRSQIAIEEHGMNGVAGRKTKRFANNTIILKQIRIVESARRRCGTLRLQELVLRGAQILSAESTFRDD